MILSITCDGKLNSSNSPNERYSNSLTVSLVFGRRVPSDKDTDMHQLFEGFEKFSLATQRNSSAILDAYPVLQNLPEFMLPMVSYAKQVHKDELALYLRLWLRVKNEIKNGTANDCFCVGMTRIQKEEGFNDEQAAYISGYRNEMLSNNQGACSRPARIPLRQH
jgi:hypothetical protein